MSTNFSIPTFSTNETQAIISYKKRPFGLECPGQNSTNFIDEKLYLELGFPNQTICYKNQKINGEFKKVVGSLVATVHLVKNEKLDKPMKFHAKIIRNLGVDAIANVKLWEKCGMTVSPPEDTPKSQASTINNDKPACDCDEMICPCMEESSNSSIRSHESSSVIDWPLEHDSVKSEDIENFCYACGCDELICQCIDDFNDDTSQNNDNNFDHENFEQFLKFEQEDHYSDGCNNLPDIDIETSVGIDSNCNCSECDLDIELCESDIEHCPGCLFLMSKSLVSQWLNCPNNANGYRPNILSFNHKSANCPMMEVVMDEILVNVRPMLKFYPKYDYKIRGYPVPTVHFENYAGT